MNADDRKAVRALCDAATPGPWCWEAHGQKSNDWTVGYAENDAGQPLTGEIEEPDFIVEAVGNSEPWILRKKVVIEQENATGYSDAAFIAAARTALPEAIDALDAMEALWNEHVEAGDCLKRIWALEAENAKLRAAGDALVRTMAHGQHICYGDCEWCAAPVRWHALSKEASDGA